MVRRMASALRGPIPRYNYEKKGGKILGFEMVLFKKTAS